MELKVLQWVWEAESLALKKILPIKSVTKRTIHGILVEF